VLANDPGAGPTLKQLIQMPLLKRAKKGVAAQDKEEEDSRKQKAAAAPSSI
jgi:hypothetical protein